jgi:hypothetical protein
LKEQSCTAVASIFFASLPGVDGNRPGKFRIQDYIALRVSALAQQTQDSLAATRHSLMREVTITTMNAGSPS